MTNEQQSVIGKIKALLAKTKENGASEGEAMNAMAKAGELLKVYNLSMDTVFLGEQECKTIHIDEDGSNRSPIRSCLLALAKFCDLKVWSTKDYVRKVSQYAFFGLESDTEMVKYLYDVINNAIEAETAKFKQSSMYINPAYGTHRKTLSTSFQKGMVSRISERLEELYENRYNEQKETMTNNGTDIVLIKTGGQKLLA